MIDEKRKYPRRPVSLQVVVAAITSKSHQSDLLKTKISNLSESGFYINDPRFKTLSFLKLEITSPVSGETIKAEGVVQFNDGCGVGVKLIKPENGKMRKTIVDFIRRELEPLEGTGTTEH